MSATLQLDNFSSILFKEKTDLTAAASPSSSPVNVSVRSTQGYAVGDLLMIGNPGIEKCEIQAVTAVVDDVTVTVSRLDYDHLVYEPVTSVVADKMKLYRAANVDGRLPADDQFAAVMTPVDIDPDQQQTTFVDDTGGTGFWYKYTFYNSQTGVETELSAASAALYGVANYCTIKAIVEEAQLQTNTHITVSRVDEARQQAQARVNNMLGGRYIVPFVVPINPAITRITTLLAAGYLMPNSIGKSKITEAENILTEIVEGIQTLRNAAGVSTELATATDLKIYPNNECNRLFDLQERY